MSIYTGAYFNSLTEISSNDDGDPELGPPCGGASNNFGSRLTIEAEVGTVDRVEIVGFSGDQGYFYIRAYPGEPRPRPDPDTEILRNSSSLGPRAIAAVRSAARAASAASASSRRSPRRRSDAPRRRPVRGLHHPLCLRRPGAGHNPYLPGAFGGRRRGRPDARQTDLHDRPHAAGHDPERAQRAALKSDRHLATGPDGAHLSGYIPCRFDSLVGNCLSKRTFSALCSGLHSFTGTGVDMAGNVDPSPLTDTVSSPAARPAPRRPWARRRP